MKNTIYVKCVENEGCEDELTIGKCYRILNWGGGWINNYDAKGNCTGVFNTHNERVGMINDQNDCSRTYSISRFEQEEK